jgi:hypothetical protein
MNERRPSVRCARAFRTLDFYCNRNAHSRPGPNMARPLVSCDGSPRGVPFSGAIVPSLSLSLSRSLSFADCFARGIMELSSSELDTGWSSLDQLVYELPDELISRLNGLAAAAATADAPTVDHGGEDHAQDEEEAEEEVVEDDADGDAEGGEAERTRRLAARAAKRADAEAKHAEVAACRRGPRSRGGAPCGASGAAAGSHG